MRIAYALIAVFGSIPLALADPPSPTATAPAASAPAATAAAPAATAAAPDAKPGVTVQGTAEQSALEKHFLAEGYKMETRNGVVVLCHREEKVGSHLGGSKVCGTAQELQAREEESRSIVNRSQMPSNNPKGN